MIGERCDNELIIRPRTGFFSFGLGEILEYRELLLYLAWRQIKVRYKQTLMGASWAIIQPLLTMMVFSVIFGTVLKVPSEGIPYPIFSYSGLLLWIYFTNSLTIASTSMVSNNALITKVYFPRMVLPISSCLFGLLDYAIALAILILMMFFYQTTPNITILLLPVLLSLTFILATGIAFWLSAVCVRYRDVQFALPFLIQLMLFATPVIYPPSFAGRFEWLLRLNPMTGIISAHRASLLGHAPINFGALGISVAITAVILITGIIYFKNNERTFADVI